MSLWDKVKSLGAWMSDLDKDAAELRERARKLDKEKADLENDLDTVCEQLRAGATTGDVVRDFVVVFCGLRNISEEVEKVTQKLDQFRPGEAYLMFPGYCKNVDAYAVFVADEDPYTISPHGLVFNASSSVELVHERFAGLSKYGVQKGPDKIEVYPGSSFSFLRGWEEIFKTIGSGRLEGVPEEGAEVYRAELLNHFGLEVPVELTEQVERLKMQFAQHAMLKIEESVEQHDANNGHMLRRRVDDAIKIGLGAYDQEVQVNGHKYKPSERLAQLAELLQ